MKTYLFSEIVAFAFQIENKEIVETKEVLRRKDKNGWSVAHELAWNHPTWSTNDIEILMLQDTDKHSVAHLLAENHPTWSTNDIEILMLQDIDKYSVAHELAWNHPTWSTENIEILSLADSMGRSVEDILIKKRRLNE